MNDGCAGHFGNGKQIADKVRMMGYDQMAMPVPLKMACENCDDEFTMDTMVAKCPACEMVYAVTPCHANDASHVMAAGINY